MASAPAVVSVALPRLAGPLMAAPTTIDLRFVRYHTTVLLASGAELVLTPYILGRSREEPDNSFSQALRVKLHDVALPGLGDLSTVVIPGTRLVQVVSYDEGRTWDDDNRYEGEIGDWSPADDEYTFEVTAYDPLHALESDKASIHAFYPAGRPCRDVLADVFARFALPVGALDGPTAPLPKVLFAGNAGELVLAVLQHALAVGDKCYLPRWDTADRHVDVIVPGGNDPIYRFDATTNVLSMKEERTTQDTIQEAEVIGSQQEAEGDPAPRPVTAIAAEELPEDQPVGITPDRKLVSSAALDSAPVAEAAAGVAVARDSAPAIWRTATTFDAAPLRKGDVVRLRAGRVDDFQVLGAISHDEDALTAEQTLAARGTPLYQAQRFEDRASKGGKSASGKGLPGLFAWCRAHMGIPYVWGGTSDAGYDCSGFTQAAFREACGVEIGRDTGAQRAKNPVGDGAPGDLVFFSHTAMVNGIWTDHVGIVGPDPGMMFHAGNPSQYAQILSVKQPMGYRRPVDFRATELAARRSRAGDTLAAAPADLADAIRLYFPAAAWATAAAVSSLETAGWTAFHNTKPPDDSHGYFQININAHGGTPAYWMDTNNNVRKAAELWRAAGGSFARDWVNSARILGLS